MGEVVTQEVVRGGLLSQNHPTAMPPSGSASDGAKVRLDGMHAGKSSSVFIDDGLLSRQTLLVGSTGTGKTNLMYHMVSQIRRQMTPDDVMLVFDSKGDFHEKFFSATSGDVVIGDSPEYRRQSAKWSIRGEVVADGRDRESVRRNVRELSEALFAEASERNSSNPFFPEAACQLFAAVIMSLVRDGIPFDNNMLLSTLESSSPDDLRSMLSCHPDLTAVVTYIGKAAGSQTQGVLSEMHKVVREVLQGVFAAPGGSFSMREFIRARGGKTAFVEYDLAIGSTLAPVYSLLFDLALKEALGRGGGRGRVYLIADELRLMPYLRHLEDGVNLGRSLGVRVIAGLQAIGQLEATYSDSARARNVTGGFSSLIAFRSVDPETREYVSEAFGQNLVMTSFPEPGGGFHREIRCGHVVEDWDIWELAVGEAVVGLAGMPPFKFRFSEFPKTGQRM